jgi:hypothetical protein
MYHPRVLLPGVLSVCLALAAGAALCTDGSEKTPKKKATRTESAKKAKPPSKAPNATTRRTSTGAAPPPDSADSGYGVDARSTITEHRSANGETVFSVSASHFDISAPLRDMAASAVTGPTMEEEESPTHPMLPSWRIPRSTVPDPVVQSQIPPGDFASRGFSLEAPATGFNFLGVGAGGTPSDSNASVGTTSSWRRSTSGIRSGRSIAP